MASINRVLTNICSDDLAKSEQFYTSLFNLKVAYTSDWFVHLTSDQAHFELGIILRTNDVVPEAHQNAPRGTYLTFVVDDVLAIFEKAKSLGYRIVQEIQDTFYGQKRLLLEDPNGLLVDVSSPIKDFDFS